MAHWVQINRSGFGVPGSRSVRAMAVHNGVLYAASLNRELGAKLWRLSRPYLDASSLVSRWLEVTPAWSGTPQDVRAMAVFGDELYVGTDQGEIQKLSRDGRWQVRRGAGTRGVALLDWAGARVAEAGRRWLRLDCDADNARLRAWYEVAGFALVGVSAGGGWRVGRYQRPVA
jgi:hypothetical protein